MPGIELRLVTPDRWKHYGTWRGAEAPASPTFDFTAARVRWPWVGPAQNYLHWYPGLRQILEEFRPDMIDLWEEPWGLVSAHACWLRDRVVPGAKVISETEQNLNKRLPPPFEQCRRYVLRRADFVVARNAEAVEVVRDKGYRGPAEVVPNAVDAELFRPMDRRVCREELGVGGFVVGYAGRLVEEKGIRDLLDAIEGCPPDVRLLLVGSGPLEGEVRQRAASAALAGRVHLISSQPLQDLPRVFNAMDVLALPSHTTARWKEQFGRVIIEAHACGVPVIGSDSGAIPDVVSEGGLVVPEHSPAALAAAIRRLHGDPQLAAKLGNAGLAQVRAHYTWARVAERMYDIYQRVMQRSDVTEAASVAQPSPCTF
jgi:glycosyltransferase involved in cell wall biosynthesis